MKQKLLAAALGFLVLVPSTVVAQDARSAFGNAKPTASVDQRPPIAVRRLPALKSSRPASGDSNANGAIIGAGVGALLGAFLGAGLASLDESSDGMGGTVALMAILGGAGGAGIGYAIDNAHHQVTYKIPVSKNVSIQPSVGLAKRPGQMAASVRAGVGASFGW